MPGWPPDDVTGGWLAASTARHPKTVLIPGPFPSIPRIGNRNASAFSRPPRSGGVSRKARFPVSVDSERLPRGVGAHDLQSPLCFAVTLASVPL